MDEDDGRLTRNGERTEPPHALENPVQHHTGPRGGYRGPGGGQWMPRSRISAEYSTPESDTERILKLLVRVGDDDWSDLENVIGRLAEVISSDFEALPSEVVSAIVTCVKCLPLKTSVYGTLSGLVNLKNPIFGRDMIQKSLEEVGNLLSCNTPLAGELGLPSTPWVQLKLLLRFLAILVIVNITTSDVLARLFERLLNEAISCYGQHGTSPCLVERGDTFLFLVAATLPWVGAELQGQPDVEQPLFEQLERAFHSRKECQRPPMQLLRPKDVGRDDLDDLWSALTQCRDDSWSVVSTLRPFVRFEKQLAEAQSRGLEDVWTDEVDSILAIAPHMPGQHYLKFPAPLNLFPRINVEKSIAAVDRWVVRQHTHDMALCFNLNLVECGKLLVGLPMPWPFEHIIVEMLFSDLLQLPTPPRSLVATSRLLIELCKASPKRFPAMLARSVFILFSWLGELELVCGLRLAWFLAHHISNFEWKWPWKTWATVTSTSADDPRRWFVIEALKQCVRMSYHENISKTLPPAIQTMLPPNPKPSYRFEAPPGDDALAPEGEAEGETVLGLMRPSRTADGIAPAATPTELGEYLRDIVEPRFGAELTLAIFVQSLLKTGSKSLAHVTSVTERYKSVFAVVAPTPELRSQLVQNVAEFWSLSPDRVIMILDKWMSLRVVSNPSILQYFLSRAGLDQLEQSVVWEVLNNTIQKTLARTETLRTSVPKVDGQVQELKALLETARADLARADTQVSDARRALDQSEAHLSPHVAEQAGNQAERSPIDGGSTAGAMPLGATTTEGARQENGADQAPSDASATEHTGEAASTPDGTTDLGQALSMKEGRARVLEQRVRELERTVTEKEAYARKLSDAYAATTIAQQRMFVSIFEKMRMCLVWLSTDHEAVFDDADDSPNDQALRKLRLRMVLSQLRCMIQQYATVVQPVRADIKQALLHGPADQSAPDRSPADTEDAKMEVGQEQHGSLDPQLLVALEECLSFLPTLSQSS